MTCHDHTKVSSDLRGIAPSRLIHFLERSNRPRGERLFQYLTRAIWAHRVADSPLRWCVAVASVAASAALTFTVGAHAATFEETLTADRPGNEQATLKGYRVAADDGDAAAEYALGRMYLGGRGVTRSDVQAFSWFRKAALQNNPGAEFELFVMFTSGAGTTRDPVQATQWLLKSATSGFEPAELELSGHYERGEVVPKDVNEALGWATKAAEQGNPDAQIKAGLLYGALALAPTRGAALTSREFGAVMDGIFGPTKWRETSGYRTRSREEELRKEGAGTVPPGVLSRHSIGSPGAPGAYDVVVQQLTMKEAAARLLSSGARFRRVVVEGGHGPEGPHLHVEPLLVGEHAHPVASAGPVSADRALSGGHDFEQMMAIKQAEGWLETAAAHGNLPAQAMLTRIELTAKPKR